MGAYIKHLQAEKVKAIFEMLGLHMEDGDIVEVKTPHGRLIDADVFYENFSPKTWSDGMYVAQRIESTATIIEEEESDGDIHRALGSDG